MNSVHVLGRLTRDPETKMVKGGELTICKFGLAFAQGSPKNKSTGFADCTAFGKTAELIAKHFTKGKQILVGGSLNFSTWETYGQKRSKLDVVVQEFWFVGDKGDRGQDVGPAPATGDEIPF